MCNWTQLKQRWCVMSTPEEQNQWTFPHGVVCWSTKSQQWLHFSPRKSINHQRTLDKAEEMQVQHVSTGEKEPTDLLHLKLLPDPQQHTQDSTPHAADFSLPTVSEPSCSYQHTTTGRKYAVKHAISESCKHSGRAEGKQRQFRFFQTVNHAKVIWDSKTKPKGIVGGHLNIQNKIRFNAY